MLKASIEYKLKEKRMADAEAFQKEKGDNYNMKVQVIMIIAIVGQMR